MCSIRNLDALLLIRMVGDVPIKPGEVFANITGNILKDLKSDHPGA
jgi:hypothetical protein